MASHRRPAQRVFARTGRVTVLSAAAAAAAALSASAPAGAAPQQKPADVKSQVDGLYEQAEAATQKYDAARESETRLRGRLETLRGELARGQQAVNTLRDRLGEIATAQYREGGIDPALTLMLSADPNSYLARAAALDRIEGRHADRLRQLHDARQAVERERRQATTELTRLESTRHQMAAHKRTVQRKLGRARALLDSLAPAQQAAIGFGPAGARTGVAGMLPRLPDLPAPSGRAAQAVAAARSVLGSPYAWGSTGPSSFDCSGLMLWSYRHAGITLPRTSQGQLHAGRRVALAQARPGDLVVYRGDASHVAMYVGGGEVIHAPYPGARVRFDPVNMMPINGIVRP